MENVAPRPYHLKKQNIQYIFRKHGLVKTIIFTFIYIHHLSCTSEFAESLVYSTKLKLSIFKNYNSARMTHATSVIADVQKVSSGNPLNLSGYCCSYISPDRIITIQGSSTTTF